MNEVVDSLLVHEGEYGFRHYIGDYDDWLRQARPGSDIAPAKVLSKGTAKPAQHASSAPAVAPRINSGRQRELKRLLQDIEKIENRIAALHARKAAPKFYQQSIADQRAAQRELAEQEAKLEQAYERWQTLESAHA